MKKCFALLMAALLFCTMITMPALAELGTVQGDMTTYNVNFDDSYYGFCLILDRRAAAENDVFTIAGTQGNANDKEGKDISNALKTLVVEYFDEFFFNGVYYTVDADGNYKMTAQKANNFQSAVYRMTDESYKTSEDIIAIVDDALAKAENQTIPDHGYEKLLSNGMKAVFDFKVFKTTQGEVDGKLQQDFIGFKVPARLRERARRRPRRRSLKSRHQPRRRSLRSRRRSRCRSPRSRPRHRRRSLRSRPRRRRPTRKIWRRL